MQDNKTVQEWYVQYTHMEYTQNAILLWKLFIDNNHP
jgi:hypothetical protein